MSEYRINRKGSSRKSHKGGRRRRSSVRSMGSYGAKDDDEEDLLKMLEEEYQKALSRDNSKKRRRKRDSVDLEEGEDEGEDEDDDEEEEEEEEEQIDQEELLAKLQHCKELMDGVKRQTWSISKKLQVLRRARAYVERFEGKLSRGKGYHQKGKELMKRWNRKWKNFTASLVPWEMKIKRIESHFGSVVASYFTFLRWLLWVSVWLAVMPTCFIIIPELLVGARTDPDTRKEVPEQDRDEEADLKTIWNAEGIVQYSPIFYGYYGNADKIGQGYRLPLAYLVTGLAAFAFSFIVVLKTMAANSRQSRMSESSDEEYIFAWKMFTEWDYMIASNETAATKHASITTTFKESILEEQEKAREGNKYLQMSLRVTANVIILILLATSTYVIQLFVERSRQLEVDKRENPNFEPGFWDANELTVIMTLISTIFPNILDIISLMEKYHPRTSLRLMLARIFVLNLLNLYTLFIALYNKQNDLLASLEDYNTNGTIFSNCSSNLTTSSPTGLSTTSEAPEHLVENNSTHCSDVVAVQENIASLCWETMIGQEVFKLTVTDLVFVVGQILLIDVIRTYFIKYANHMCCWDMEKTFPEYPDFKTAENLLHLISNQGTIWLGSFFAPGLPLLNLLKLLMLVYLRCWVVLTYNAPQERIFRASRSNNFYFSLLLIMLFLCMLPPLFAIVAVEPSPYCGPFSGSSRIYHVLTRTMTQELPESASAVIEYAASPGVILPVFMLLGMTIYYLLAVGQSLRDVNTDLKLQLEYERTEGRKKVYAMADARHEASEKAKGKGWVAAKSRLIAAAQTEGGKKQGMVSTANSVLQALRASKNPSDMSKRKPPGVAPKPGREDGEGGGGGMSRRTLNLLQKLQNAQRAQTAVPVAVIEGKQSVKAVRERDTNEAKSVFRRALLDQARRQKTLAEGAIDNETRPKNNRETPLNRFTKAQPRRPEREVPSTDKRGARNNSTHQTAQTSSRSRRRGDDSEIETDPTNAPNVSSRRSPRHKSRSSSGRDRNRRDAAVDKSSRRTTKAEVHHVTSRRDSCEGRRVRRDNNHNEGSRDRRGQKNLPNGVISASAETASAGPKPKKPLLRRVSSSSVIDETGHLRPCDEDDDDDDDDDDDEDDDVDGEEDDSLNEDETDAFKISEEDDDESDDEHDGNSDNREDGESREDEEDDDDCSDHSAFSEEHDTDHVSEDEHLDIGKHSNSDDDGSNASTQIPASPAYVPRLSNKRSKDISQKSNPKSKSSNVSSKNAGKTPSQIARNHSAQIEIIDESTTPKSRRIGKIQHKQELQQNGKPPSSTAPQEKDGARKVSPRLGSSSEEASKNVQPPKESIFGKKKYNVKNNGQNKEKSNGNSIQRSYSLTSSNGQVPTITVEDFSGNSSPATPEVQQPQKQQTINLNEATSGKKTAKDPVKSSLQNNKNVGKSFLDVNENKSEEEDKGEENKPPWMSMKLRPVNKDKIATGDSNSSSGSSSGKISGDPTKASGQNSKDGSKGQETRKISNHKGESSRQANEEPDEAVSIQDSKRDDSSGDDIRDTGFRAREKRIIGADKDGQTSFKPSGKNRVQKSDDSDREPKVMENLTTHSDFPKAPHHTATLNQSNNKSNKSKPSLSPSNFKIKPSMKKNEDSGDGSKTAIRNSIHQATDREPNFDKRDDTKAQSINSDFRGVSDAQTDQQNNLEPNDNQTSASGGEPPDSPEVFTFDEPVFISSPSGYTPPDSPVNFGRFRTDRPSLANIHIDAEEGSQNGESSGIRDVITTEQSESRREESTDESGGRLHSKTRQRVLSGNPGNNLRRLSSNTPVQHKETSSLPNGQRFTVLAITNGDLHLEASDDDELQ